MDETKSRVDGIKAEVEQTSKLVAIEKEKTQILIDEVEEETAKANIEEEAAAIIAEKTKVIKDAADLKKADVDRALAAAIPAMENARNAVAGLSKDAIGVMKGFANPPLGVPEVGRAVFILRGEYNPKKSEWPMVQNMMKDPAKFMTMLENYKKEEIPDKAIELLKPI